MPQTLAFCRDRLTFMDPLSEALSQVSARSAVFAGLKAGGPWAIDFPAPDGIKFNAVLEGECWLRVEGLPAPMRVRAGDGFLLPRGRAFSLCSHLDLPAVPADTVYHLAVDGIARCGSGKDFFLIGGRFDFAEQAAFLFDGLPAAVLIEGGSQQACVLQWALQRMAHELGHPALGGALVIQHLGHLMLVQALRLYLMQDAAVAPSGLRAMGDPRIGASLHAIHADPAHPWTVERLARIAGMSRSSFALRFKRTSGLAPLEYVSRWRMHKAMKALRTTQAAVSTIGQQLGYASDSAFSHAFKRLLNCSPLQYRQGWIQTRATHD